ncbi:MAG: hypothetical protein J5884_06470 [Paludibacteraceae bacterium]|nr:hypothetical protein [Paludibacteraceae bacterium]
MKKFANIVIILILTGCSIAPRMEEDLRPVERCAECPEAITSAASFVAESKVYVFGGRTTEQSWTNAFYSYDPQTDSWTQQAPAPIKTRVRPRAIEVDDEVYIGLGYHGYLLSDTAYLTDWWQWTPATNEWKQLSSFPSKRTVGPVIASNGRSIYVANGAQQNFERWIFRYDIDTDKWTKLADGLPRMASYPPRAHSSAGGFCQGQFFLGSGYTRDGSANYWVEAELREDSVVWHRRTPFQGKRHNAVSISDGKYIYLIGGRLYGGTVTNGTLYDDVLRYNPEKDCWLRIARLPDGERENLCAWIIDDVLYVGLGNDKRNEPCAQIYKIRL